MREMRDSGIEWVGAIPAAWGVHRIASHFQEIKEKNTANAYSNALQFKMGKIIAKPQKWDEDETNETYSAYTVVHPNTIMINGLNLEFDFVTQRVARVECDGIITSAYIALSARDDINAEYICYLLKSYDACRAFHSMGRGLRKILSYSELKNKPLVVPPLAEQERIAAFLDAECAEIDAVLEKTRASIEEYKKLKQAVITQAVTKGIRGDRPMKDSGIEWIGDIPAEWDYTKAKNCVDIQNGSDPKTEGSIPVYGSGASSFKTCGEYKEGPSVLIGRKGATLHIPHYISTKFWNVDTAFNVYAKPNFDLKFYFYCACSFDYRFYISQTTLPSMTQTAYENMFLPLPSNDEQRAIASYLDNRCEEIDALIWKKQECLAEIENYKKSLIYEYVTGKKEVKTSVLAD